LQVFVDKPGYNFCPNLHQTRSSKTRFWAHFRQVSLSLKKNGFVWSLIPVTDFCNTPYMLCFVCVVCVMCMCRVCGCVSVRHVCVVSCVCECRVCVSVTCVSCMSCMSCVCAVSCVCVCVSCVTRVGVVCVCVSCVCVCRVVCVCRIVQICVVCVCVCVVCMCVVCRTGMCCACSCVSGGCVVCRTGVCRVRVRLVCCRVCVRVSCRVCVSCRTGVCRVCLCVCVMCVVCVCVVCRTRGGGAGVYLPIRVTSLWMSRNFSNEFRVTNLSSKFGMSRNFFIQFVKVLEFFRFSRNFVIIQNLPKIPPKFWKLSNFSHHNFTLFPPNSTDFPQEINWQRSPQSWNLSLTQQFSTSIIYSPWELDSNFLLTRIFMGKDWNFLADIERERSWLFSTPQEILKRVLAEWISHQCAQDHIFTHTQRTDSKYLQNFLETFVA
jgi:hypothetical protein